jgi:hypothetical protein
VRFLGGGGLAAHLWLSREGGVLCAGRMPAAQLLSNLAPTACEGTVAIGQKSSMLHSTSHAHKASGAAGGVKL